MIRWERARATSSRSRPASAASATAPYDSLNLTRGTGDDAARVEENRRVACESLGLDRRAARVQPAGALADGASGDAGRARRAGRRPLDATSRGVPLLAHVRRLPADRDRAHGDGPRGARRPARGLARARGGIVAAGVAALGAGDEGRVIGPAIGPCCYEVGTEVSERFDADLTRGPASSTSGRRPSARCAPPACDAVERARPLHARCHPELFFSHRRDGRARGVQGVIGAVA